MMLLIENGHFSNVIDAALRKSIQNSGRKGGAKKVSMKIVEDSCLRKNIQKKILRYAYSDNDKYGRKGDVSIEDILQLLETQNYTCYICDEKVITLTWNPYCCYQFSVDRIDNDRPHDRNNVLISCYYCNCRNHPEFNQENKICNKGCHIIPKENITLRSSVDINKIKNLLLPIRD
jgi:ribosomal protein S28E/S33